jgi:hypothetical protein
MTGSRRVRRVLLVVVLVAFINLPVLHSTWTSWRVDRSGTDVSAALAEHRVVSPDDDPRYWLGFRFPDEIDPGRQVWSAEVDRATYDAAVAERTVEVRVLADNPAAYRAEGQVRRWFGLVTTLVADAILLLIVLLVWRYGGRSRPAPLRMAAIGDVERCPPGVVFEQIEGTLHLVRGEVVEIGDGEIVLDLGEREVVVVLDGHHNPVGHQQPAQVRGRVLG